MPDGAPVRGGCGGVVYYSSGCGQARSFGGGEFLHKSGGYEGMTSGGKQRCRVQRFRQRDLCAIDKTLPHATSSPCTAARSVSAPDKYAATTASSTAPEVKCSPFQPPVILRNLLHLI